MPRVYLTNEERECRRFSDFVRGELKRQGKRHRDLADYLNTSQVNVTYKINGKVAWSLSDIILALEFLKSSYVIGG